MQSAMIAVVPAGFCPAYTAEVVRYCDAEPRMLKTALNMAVCFVDIATFTAATKYHETAGLPFKAQLSALLDIRAKHLNRLAWEQVQAVMVEPPRCLPSGKAQLWLDAAAGSTTALRQLTEQYSSLRFERGPSGELIVKPANV